jgi:GNAT superfamily N-acetyltransferase
MTSGSMTLRVARLEDAHAIADLTRQLGYEVPVSTLSERLARLLPRSDQCFLVAELDGDVVGWVHVVVAEYIDTGVYAQIGGLVVDRRQRNKGVGRLLMTRAEEWAHQQGCAAVRLWSSAIRTEAHRFYERLGYTNVKAQYAFVKSLNADAEDVIRAFTPRIDR